jgi:hypothetical protein
MAKGLIRPTAVDRAWVAANPVAALVGYGSTILAAFGIFDLLGLTADQVAILGGSVMGVVASLQTLRERRQRKDVEELVAQNDELKKAASSMTDGQKPAAETSREPPGEAAGPRGG